VWANEFDQPGAPDSQDWQFETNFARPHELQGYQPKNARYENGLPVIVAKQETRPNPTYKAGRPDWRTSRPTIDYPSASPNTSGRHQWQYGRFKLCGCIDTRAGLWPAFWTLGLLANCYAAAITSPVGSASSSGRPGEGRPGRQPCPQAPVVSSNSPSSNPCQPPPEVVKNQAPIRKPVAKNRSNSRARCLAAGWPPNAHRPG
jgi:hypothetical protein